MKKFRCPCELCKLARAFERLARKASRSEKAALEIVWSRMADAETALDITQIKTRLRSRR